MPSKYERLTKHLESQPATTSDVTLSFRELESILGFKLPKSASEYRAWWANETDAKNHTQARAWISAGFIVDAVHQTAPMWVRYKRAKKNLQ